MYGTYISSTKNGRAPICGNVFADTGELKTHYTPGVWTFTFREDESRLRNRHAADNLAWLKRFAISLLKQQADNESVAMRRRMAGWNPDYLAQVLGISET